MKKILTPTVEGGPITANLDERDNIFECAPIHVALLYRRIEILKALLDAGASPNKTCEGLTPIHVACHMGAYANHREFANLAAQELLSRTIEVRTVLSLFGACGTAFISRPRNSHLRFGRPLTKSTTPGKRHSTPLLSGVSASSRATS